MISRLIAHFVLNVVALYLLTKIFDGSISALPGTISITSDKFLETLLIAGFIFSIVNTFIKPILNIFTIPFKIITFGLITFVLNGAILMLVHYILPEYQISSFFTAILGAIFVSIFQFIAHIFVR